MGLTLAFAQKENKQQLTLRDKTLQQTKVFLGLFEECFCLWSWFLNIRPGGCDFGGCNCKSTVRCIKTWAFYN
jgi:hypothetical protein